MTGGDETVFRQVPCDLCGADDFATVGRPVVSPRIKQVVRPPQDIAVVRCRQCGFLYTHPMPFWSTADTQHIYDAAYFPPMTPWWQRVKTKDNPRRRLDAIERRLDSAAPRFLEVGCGLGYGIEEAVRRGWTASGQDVSRFFCEQVAGRLGVSVFLGQLEDAGYAESSFDAVYIDSVIEHVPQPMNMLREVHRILTPGGVAHLTVTNEAALVNTFRRLLLALARPRRSPVLSPLAYPVHLVGFTPGTLILACQRAGFEVTQLTVHAGKQEWRKRGLRSPRQLVLGFASLPLTALGEATGRGIALEAVIAARK